MCPTGRQNNPPGISAGKFISIGGGECTIGLYDEAYRFAAECAVRSGLREEYVRNCVPAHRVFLKHARISGTLVTCAGFAEFERGTGYITEAEKDGWGWTWEGGWIRKNGLSWRNPFGNEADDIYHNNREVLPVLQISWDDAAAWCAWRTEVSGELVRFPSEAEWEVFAGTIGIKTMSETLHAGESPVSRNSTEYITAILEEIHRPGGVHRTGLVWEWCDDWFRAYPGGFDNREFGEVYKVLRGGSLMSVPLQRAADYRYRRCPTARSPYYGFRAAIG